MLFNSFHWFDIFVLKENLNIPLLDEAFIKKQILFYYEKSLFISNTSLTKQWNNANTTYSSSGLSNNKPNFIT